MSLTESDRIVTAVAPRVLGFAPWTPAPSTQEMLDAAKAVLDEYRVLGLLPLTIRQVFYRLVANGSFDRIKSSRTPTKGKAEPEGKPKLAKSEANYKRLGEYINRARRAGILSFNDFRDDGTTRNEAPGYQSVEELEQVVDDVRSQGINKQVGLPIHQLVSCEAAGMVPQLAAVAHDYGVDVISSSGFDGVGAKYSLAQSVSDRGVPVIVHHFGDYDPSGLHVFQSFAEDVGAFVTWFGGRVTFKRVAITPGQIRKFKLPMATAKATDARAFDGRGTVQLEALDPRDIAKLLKTALEENLA